MNKKKSIQDNYNSFLKEILKIKLYETAINLNQALVKKFNISAENARQALTRAVKQRAIKSSSPYTFGKKQYVYIDADFELNVSSIKSITKKTRPAIYRLLALMDNNGGIVSYYEALKITASPIKKNITKVTSLDDIINLLSKLEIVYLKKDHNNVNYIIYKDAKQNLPDYLEEVKMKDHFSKMVMDCSILPDVIRWLGKSNLIINSNVIYRNKKTPAIGAQHNNLIWDAFAYTKSTGINDNLGSKSETTEKQTLVVLDVVLSTEYLQIHLDAFYDRIQINRNSVKELPRKVLPIIIYSNSSDLVLNTISKLGIIAFDISSIFGNKIYDILSKTKELSLIFKEPEKIDHTIEKILSVISKAGQEDALKELKGTLFEFLMYPLLSSIYPVASIQRGKTISRINEDGEKESYEYDYIIHSSNPKEIIIVELKGYHSGATIPLGNHETKSSLKWFFNKTLPFAINKYKSDISEGSMAKGVYITSANFWEDGKQFIEVMNNSKYKSLSLNTGYEREDLIKLLKERGFNNEIKILKKFYDKKE